LIISRSQSQLASYNKLRRNFPLPRASYDYRPEIVPLLSPEQVATMAMRRILSLTMGLFLMGGITLLAAPTKEEADAEKYTKMLKSSKDAKDRALAVKELGRLGRIATSLAKPAVPDIIKALDDSDAKVRAEAAHAIGMIDPEKKKEVVEKLIKILKDDKEETVKRSAAMGLGAMGADAKDSVSALRDAAAKAGKKDAQAYQNAIMTITGKK